MSKENILNQMMGKERHHLVVFCEEASGTPPSVAPVFQGIQIHERKKLANLFGLLLTETNQMLIVNFYFDLPSMNFHARSNCLYACVAEEEICSVRVSLSHLGL